jgi:hypothetical protein
MTSVLLLICLFQPPAPDKNPVKVDAGPVVTLELPKVIPVETGTIGELPPKTNGKKVKYKALDKGITIRQGADPNSKLSDKTFALVTGAPGKYRVYANTALADEPSEIVEVIVNIGKVPDSAPFGPYKPDAKPVNPDNPPDVVPDDPNDPLIEAIKGIYGGLSSNDPKAKDKVLVLAKVFRDTAKQVSEDQTLLSVGDVFGAITSKSSDVLGKRDIFDIRDLLRNEMNTLVPKNTSLQLTPELRGKMQKVFDRFGFVLEQAIK